ncbi:Cu(I)-responsive transcriptional regulator [Fodinicurvata halophila]|uniref:Cu(I)-responsive transcriptional regulator n=1 Tax=Fodinicurvata halophila TaxID=1419723 RepID=A0ABV8UKQ3_9PROT
MNIGQAAQKSGVPAKTIRYYESVGLIDAPQRTAASYRVYHDQEVQILRFIQRARSLGFSVHQVSELMALWKDRDRSSSQVKALARHHVEEIEMKIAELSDMRDTLMDLMDRCHGDSRPDCPILKELAREAGDSKS